MKWYFGIIIPFLTLVVWGYLLSRSQMEPLFGGLMIMVNSWNWVLNTCAKLLKGQLCFVKFLFVTPQLTCIINEAQNIVKPVTPWLLGYPCLRIDGCTFKIRYPSLPVYAKGWVPLHLTCMRVYITICLPIHPIIPFLGPPICWRVLLV